MNDKYARGCGVVAAAAILFPALAGTAFAAPSHPALPGQLPPQVAAISPSDRLAVQTLAKSILNRLSATASPVGGCAAPTLETLRAAVTSAIGQTDPSREIALAALALARQQAPPSASCMRVALDDTSDELDGSGATVDDASTVRGFTLYMGPLPPFVRRVSNP